MALRQISIGTLSKETEIPVSTIRTWENRYGVPKASGRTKGNHRLYDVDVIEHLKLINQALQINTRASEIVPLSLEELNEICCPLGFDGEESEICAWLQLVHDLDEQALHSALQRSVSILGLEQFILQRVIPFVELLGNEWRNGTLQIFEEHFATINLIDFLSGLWHSINKFNRGEKVILAGLPNEKHTLGLHFTACFLALHGYSVIFLGANTPYKEVVHCYHRIKAEILVFSISVTYDMGEALEYLLALQEDISPSHKIIIGGRGAPKTLPRMMNCLALSDLIFLLNRPTS